MLPDHTESEPHTKLDDSPAYPRLHDTGQTEFTLTRVQCELALNNDGTVDGHVIAAQTTVNQ